MNCSDKRTILFLPRTDSTNTHVKRHRETLFEHPPVFLLAEVQTGGRGRDERVWNSPRGGFYGTLVQRIPESPPLSHGFLSLLAGLGVRDVLAQILPRSSFDLKWPNDILHRGRKIAGILVENQIMGSRWISLWGIGINLDRHGTPFPEVLKDRAVSLDELGAPAVGPVTLACRLWERFEYWIETWENGRLELIREALETAGAAFRGKRITVHDRGRLRQGIYREIDDQGGLRMELESGKKWVCYSGEIAEKP